MYLEMEVSSLGALALFIGLNGNNPPFAALVTLAFVTAKENWAYAEGIKIKINTNIMGNAFFQDLPVIFIPLCPLRCKLELCDG